MKKVLLAAAMLLALGASAQLSAQERGKISVGGGLSYMTEGSWIGVGAKARYGLTDDIRLEGGVNYFLPKNNVSALDFGVNAHYVVSLDEKISVYPLVGISYYRASVSLGGATVSNGDLTINFGGGASYQLNNKLSLGAELKYQTYIKTPVVGVNAMFTL